MWAVFILWACVVVGRFTFNVSRLMFIQFEIVFANLILTINLNIERETLNVKRETMSFLLP